MARLSESSPYVEFDRAEWRGLRMSTPLKLTEDELTGLRGMGEPIDLLLTDVMMPGMTGPELAMHVKTRMPDTRVVYVSGYPEEILGQYGLPAEAVLFVQKPYTREVLVGKVREALAG